MAGILSRPQYIEAHRKSYHSGESDGILETTLLLLPITVSEPNAQVFDGDLLMKWISLDIVMVSNWSWCQRADSRFAPNQI